MDINKFIKSLWIKICRRQTRFSIRYTTRFAGFPEKGGEQTFTIFSFRRFNGTFNDRGFRQHTGGPLRRDTGLPRIIKLHLIIITSCPTSQSANELGL